MPCIQTQKKPERTPTITDSYYKQQKLGITSFQIPHFPKFPIPKISPTQQTPKPKNNDQIGSKF
jgi:hypothetical protein